MEEEKEEEGVVLPLSLIELGNESPLNLDHVNGISFSPLTDTLTRSASRLPPQPGITIFSLFFFSIDR